MFFHGNLLIKKFGASKLIFILTILFATQSGGKSNAIEIETVCAGGKSCWYHVTGRITAESPTILASALEDFVDMDSVLLESTGGDLKAGIEMGRLIRRSGMKTRVGGLPEFHPANNGMSTCASACAYAFLGGSERIVADNGQLGFHSFYMNEQYYTFVLSERAFSDAQRFASDIVLYVVEMGVDPRIFVDASKFASDEMLFLTFDEYQKMERYGIVTPENFSSFDLLPYKNGVIAVSQRQVPNQAYDELMQLTAYCSDGEPHLLYKSRVSTVPVSGTTSIFLNENSEFSIEVAEENIRVVPHETGAFIHVLLETEDADAIGRSRHFASYLPVAPVDGGVHEFRKTITSEEGRSIAAAFRLCIS